MRFRIDPDWGDLDSILEVYNLKPVAFRLDIKNIEWAVIDDEIDAGSLQSVEPGAPFLVGGQPVFIYIRDTKMKARHNSANEAVKYPAEYTRIHLTECTRISEMRRENRFARYVRTNKKTGPLRMNLTDRDGQLFSVSMDLRVCMLCLGATNWNGYRSLSGDPKRKKEIWESFSRAEFLEAYSPTFVTTPSDHEDDAPHIYTGDWADISSKARERVDFTCDACGVSVGRSNAHLLDTHHKNHVKSDNRSENLSVLCKLCHAEFHPHYEIQSDHAGRIAFLRAAQGIRR